MPKIMKNLNNISRAQAQFRAARLTEGDICPAHHTILLAVSRMAGSTQDKIAQDICLSKSAASRALGQLEERGYIRRSEVSEDKRCFAVYPTEKAERLIGAVRALAAEWNEIILEGVSEEALNVFSSVLAKMEANAKKAIKSGGV